MDYRFLFKVSKNFLFLMKPRTGNVFIERIRKISVENFGGLFNAHIHGDRVYTREDKYYEHKELSISDFEKFGLKEKQNLTWVLHSGPAFEPECIEKRMRRLIEESIACGVKRIDTTVDITYNTEFKSLEVAEKLKKEYKENGKMDLRIGAYNPSGFKDSEPQRFEIFEEGVRRADFIVALPEKDEKPGHIGAHSHNFYMLNLAYKYKKPIHFHVGQANLPHDRSVEILLEDIYWKLDVDFRTDDFPEIDFVHFISPFCKPDEELDEIIDKLKKYNIGVICCPRAGISMRQDRRFNAPIHNSLANICYLAWKGEGKIRLKLGVDNLYDVFVPASDADIATEAAEAANILRFYDERIWAKIASGEPLDDFDRGKIERALFNS